MRSKLQQLAGWGQYPRIQGQVARPEQLSQLKLSEQNHYIPRGNARSYGDAALPSKHGIAISTERLDRLLDFNADNDLVTAEAGVTLKTIIDTFLPQGWFPSVVPGTQYVSLGGCVASDIHGKNHHQVGSFSEFVPEFKLITANKQKIICRPNQNSDYYYNTVGAQGLTGLITEVSFRLQTVGSEFMSVKSQCAKNLTELMQQLESTNQQPYNVAWLDGFQQGAQLGKGVVLSGAHADASNLSTRKKRQKTVPRCFPSCLLNRYSQQIYNFFYYRKKNPSLMHYQDFFFPLDHLKHWYRLYGAKGFIQYQIVVPTQHAENAIRKILGTLQKDKQWPYLAVLKYLGDANQSPLSFPEKGFTLALDMPFSKKLLTTLDQLDAITLEHSGRVYLTKDARLSASAFKTMYPAWQTWHDFKKTIDPTQQFRSQLSDRLGLTS